MNAPVVQALGIEDPRWPAFVSVFPAANIFHSPLMARVFSASEGFEVYPLFALTGDQIVAAAFPVLVRLRRRLLGKFANRLVMFASPLYSDTSQGSAGVSLILERAKAIVRSKGLFLEVRNSESFPKAPADAALQDFEYIPYQNYLLDLTVGPEQLWSSVSGYVRNHVRKAAKKGAMVRDMRAEELPAVVSMIAALYQRKGIPLPDQSIFGNAYALLKPGGNIRAVVLETGNKVVAARLSLNYAGTVYDWYAASEPGFNELTPNEVLAWDSIKWGAENGYRVFDFGGGAVRGQEYGPAKFKEKFHGQLVEFGRYRYSGSPLLYAIARRAYELLTVRRKSA